MGNRLFEAKKKIILNNDSKIFNNWREATGISQEDFLEGIKWLCEEEKDKKGMDVRAMGCSSDGKIVKLRRIRDKYGEFVGFYEYVGSPFGSYNRYRGQVVLNSHDKI